MNKVLSGLLVATSLLSFAALPTIATAATTAKAVKTLKCPSCGMLMSTKKTAGAPVAVKIKGVTYYCCKACASGQSAMKAAKKTM